MIINYLGGGSFKLQSGSMSLLVDPESNRFKADITLRTLTPANWKIEEGSAGEEIAIPGEYELKGIEVLGAQVPEESTEKFLKIVYLVKWEGMRLAFLGHISKTPSSAIIEHIDEPDVLFLPIGGTSTSLSAGGRFLPADAAAKLVKQLKPVFAIPTFYKKPDEFLKAMGQKAEPEDKLVFKKKDLETGKTKVVVLKS